MSAFLAWLASAPQGAIAVLTALLAAGAALLVAFLTQWVLGKRTRTELLTKKLEELYPALNELSAHNVRRFEEARPLAVAGPFNKPKIAVGSVERQGLDLHKKIIMLVRLYFPKLSRTHQLVFGCNSAVNLLIHEAECGPPLLEERLLFLSGAYGDALFAMEEELIKNRRLLVKDYVLFARYRRAPFVPSAPDSCVNEVSTP